MKLNLSSRLLSLAFVFCFLNAESTELPIVVDGPQDLADITTHEIRSGDVVLGVSDRGGGYINKLLIPGLGDVMNFHAARYGRGGQVAIRDELHGRRYNPTQAGFTDTAGTPVKISVRNNVIFMQPRPLVLWNGDGEYDFTQWEDIAADSYRTDGGNSDNDGVDESVLAGKQDSEIRSEFDFAGQYSSFDGGGVIKIPVFRFYYEFRYVRQPGHAIRQFGESTPIYRKNFAVGDISNESPAGVHPSTETTLASIILSSDIRGDRDTWSPSVVYTAALGGGLKASNSVKPMHKTIQGNILPLVILSTSSDPNFGPAIGFFQPISDVNVRNVIGRSSTDDRDVYFDSRVAETRMIGSLLRTKKMWLMGAKIDISGLLSPKEASAGIYEAVRGESYILIGTPKEIFDAASKIR